MGRPAALILAGGRATRMGGGDKPLLDLGGRPILARVLDALRPQAGAVALSANGDPSRFARFGLPVLADREGAGEGPLAGLLAGLDWAAGTGADALLTIPGDTPFPPADLVARLSPAPACAESLGRRHHLVALWPVASRDVLRALLSRPGPRGVHRFADAIGTRAVPFPAGDRDPFLNLNTPEDLAAARALL